jgi:hypothetical protein
MKLIKFTSAILFIMAFSGCSTDKKCKDRWEITYYGESNLRTKTVKNCSGNIKSYEHFQVDCKNCSAQIIYSDDGSPDSLKGKAWIHVFWNNGMDFNMGDTLDVTVEVLNPPNLQSEFRITDNDGNSDYTRLDSLDAIWNDDADSAFFISGAFYNYRTVIDDSTEYFEMENTFSYKGKPWKTAKRNQKFFELK